jgi:hypothetical protein
MYTSLRFNSFYYFEFLINNPWPFFHTMLNEIIKNSIEPWIEILNCSFFTFLEFKSTYYLL